MDGNGAAPLGREAGGTLTLEEWLAREKSQAEKAVAALRLKHAAATGIAPGSWVKRAGCPEPGQGRVREVSGDLALVAWAQFPGETWERLDALIEALSQA
jgi:hypothetical protein